MTHLLMVEDELSVTSQLKNLIIQTSTNYQHQLLAYAECGFLQVHS